ncbi:MAG: hypothetical protein JW760_09630 [Spirochaetales bacterium]|nr:hypothetical protein [Spirochaetales bacterium]
MKILPVRTKTDMKAFVRFPARLYKDSACWAPPLWRDEKTAYSGKKNVILKNSDYRMFLALGDAGEVLGRVLAYVDHSFNAFYGTATGFFGAFEAVQDPAAAGALLEAAETWLRGRGMTTVRGPINPVAECWGVLVEGFSSVPVFMAPYNPPFYDGLLAGLGYGKAKDLLAYEADTIAGYRIPDRFQRFSDGFAEKRPEFTVRRIDLKNLLRDAEAIWSITNTALKDNWGYVPVDRTVMIDMVKRLKMILNPDAVWFVEKDGTAVAYALGFPDINPTLRKINGRMFPFGFAKLLSVKRTGRRFRLFGLAVMPEYHGLGLDVLLYKHMHDALAPQGIVMEANYILEDNFNIRNALEKLEMKHTKTYRVYEKALV